MLAYLAVCLVPAFWISFLVTWLMRAYAPRLGLIDQPAARKFHQEPTPLGGGIGICLAVLVMSSVFGVLLAFKPELLLRLFPPGIALDEDSPDLLLKLLAVLGGGLVLAVMGLIDDRIGLPWKPRLAVQFVVAGGMVLCGIRGTIFIEHAWIGGLLTVLWIVVLINAFNFLDNMDALSSGIGLVTSMVFAVIMLSSPGNPNWIVAGFLLILVGALLGFLCHNWPPARIFMGDSGSYFIGLCMATVTIIGTFYDYSGEVGRHVILAPLCVLAIPLYDFVSVVILRLSEGRSPFHADKRHFSHRLVDLGMRPVSAVLTIHLATMTTGLGALLLFRVRDWTGAWLIIALVICVLAIIAILEAYPRSRVKP